MNKLKVKNDEDKDDEYKDDNSQSHKSDESVINKSEEEESLTDLFISMNFPIKFINCMLVTISLCYQKIV